MPVHRLTGVVLAALAFSVLSPRTLPAAEFTNTRKGFKFTYPDNWTPLTPPDANAAVIATAAGVVQSQGALASGSAMIGVYPLLPMDNPDTLWRFMHSTSSDMADSTVTRNSSGSISQVEYNERFGDDVYHNREIFKPLGTGWVHISLRYHDNDANAATYQPAWLSVSTSFAPTAQ